MLKSQDINPKAETESLMLPRLELELTYKISTSRGMSFALHAHLTHHL